MASNAGMVASSQNRNEFIHRQGELAVTLGFSLTRGGLALGQPVIKLSPFSPRVREFLQCQEKEVDKKEEGEDDCTFAKRNMAHLEPALERETLHVNTDPGKPRILLAASGSVAAIKFGSLCHSLSNWAEVRAVATKSSLHFIDKASLPRDVILYTDEDEWSTWKKIGDSVLHIELRKWADAMVIAPLSANTLGKIAGGLCDNLLTCVVRAWDFSKPLFVAPAMNTFMWSNPFTQRHLETISELGVSLIPPITKRLACGDYGNGAMAEPSLIYSTVRLSLQPRVVNMDG